MIFDIPSIREPETKVCKKCGMKIGDEEEAIDVTCVGDVEYQYIHLRCPNEG